jgi:predicted GIY-YIG superfamily endonuclease
MARIRSVKPGLFGSQVADADDACAGSWKGIYPARETILYRFYDADGTLLYVGVTGRLAERWTAHRRSASWWPRIERLVTEKLPCMDSALAAERRAIRTELPAFNKRGA